jgi:spermidine synthase
MAVRMPQTAQRDLIEWAPDQSVEGFLASIISRELPLEKSLNPDRSIRITDDRPLNEYFLLRR